MKVVYHQFIKKNEAILGPAIQLAVNECDLYQRETAGTRPFIKLQTTEPTSKNEHHEIFLTTDRPDLVERVNKRCGLWLRPTNETPGSDLIVDYFAPSEPPTQEELDNAKKFNEGLKSLLRNNPKK